MPLYEYKCQACGKTFEVIQKFADEPLKTHPECGGVVERLFSAPAFHLKGTGWYATDYGKGNAKPGKSDDPKGDGKSEKTESKSDGSKSDGSKSDKSDSSSSAGESKSESKPAPASTDSKPSPAP